MPKNVTTNEKQKQKPQARQTPELVDEIFRRLSQGESLNKICSTDDMPARQTVFRWIMDSKEIAAKFNEALTLRAEKMAEEILEIADEEPPVDGETGKIDSAWIAWQKNRMDARKWTSSKLLPKKYGEKVALGGADDLGPVKVEAIERVIIDAKK